MSLSEQKVQELEDILFSDHLDDEALDYFGVHGLVCAHTVGPQAIEENALITLISGNDDHQLSKAEVRTIKNAIIAIQEDILSAINEGNDITLPYQDESNKEEDSHFDACLESWCTGFIEGFFYNEEAWFTKGEDVAAELLLPIMALSGLFDSEEFNKIRSNEKLTSQFEEIMPEQIVDIFLFYHSD